MRHCLPCLLVVVGACAPSPATVAPTPVAPASEPVTAPDPSPTAAVPSPPVDAVRTPSGVRYVRQRGPGAAAAPDQDDEVVVRFRVLGERGDVVAHSSPDGTPTNLDMTRLPAGWAEAMQLLGPGDRAQIWVPAALGFAEDETGPTGALFVEVEVVDVVRRTIVDAAKLPIAAAPGDAIRTASGLAYVYIHHGAGTAKPTRAQKVEAHYTGWTTDGKKFDSSYDRGEPIEFGLDQVILGWTEALQLMVVGDRIRVWIPESLAYKGKPGRPAGMLVFDIELLAIR